MKDRIKVSPSPSTWGWLWSKSQEGDKPKVYEGESYFRTVTPR